MSRSRKSEHKPHKYNFKSARAGDYYAPNTTSMANLLALNGKLCVEDSERYHFREQVEYFLAARSITERQGQLAYSAAGLTRDGGFR